MASFPLFVELEGRRCLVVGGGPVALRKAQALADFGACVAAVAPRFCPGWDETTERAERPFAPEDLADAALVVAATDDPALNRVVADACRAAGVPVNAVDDPAACTFYFPALVRRGALTVGISTGGRSPAAAAHIRRCIEEALPDEGLAETLDYLGGVRARVKESVPAQARADVFAALFAACMERRGALTKEEFDAVCRAAQEEGT